MSRLLSLPTELLYRITDAAGYYDYNSHYWNRDFDGELRSRGRLLNLALTCKALADIALPLLYRSPTTNHAGGYHDGGTSLITTLCTRPDLAAHVAELNLSVDSWGYMSEAHPAIVEKSKRKDWQISPAEADIFNQGFRDHRIAGASEDDDEDDDEDEDEMSDDARDGEPSAVYQLQAIKAPADERCEDEWSDGACRALSALAILNTPNLRHLMLESDRSPLPRTVKPLITLDKLTEMYWARLDTEGGIHLGSCFNWLFQAAPALKKLGLRYLHGISGLAPCHHVTELVISYGGMGDEDVDAICTSFPKLEKLSLGMESSEYAADMTTPAYVARALARAYKNSLQYLRLDWSGAEVESDYWEDEEASLDDIAALTSLTELVLVSPLLHRNDEENEVDFWRSLLSPSLERLAFNYCNSKWRALPLLEAVRADCPQMNKVTMEAKEAPEDDAELKSMQEAGAVGFDFSYKLLQDPSAQMVFAVESDADGGDDDDEEEDNVEDDEDIAENGEQNDFEFD